MIRAVLDEVVPADFAPLMNDGEINVVLFPDEWRSLPDGRLLTLAIAGGYDWLVTCDKQMPFQQNLSGKPLAVLVLPSPRIIELERMRPALLAALRKPAPGRFVILDDQGCPSGEPVPLIIGRTRKTN